MGNTDEFYITLRWSKWENDASDVTFDEAILILNTKITLINQKSSPK